MIGNAKTQRARGIIARLSAATLVALVFASATDAAGTRPVQTVALEGQTAPGTGGATFTNFDEPFTNTSGQVTFWGCYTGPGCGVFLLSGGALSPVAVAGQIVAGVGTLPLPDLGGTNTDGPALNNAGTVALKVGNIVGSTTAAIFQKTLSGPLTAIVKQGDAAPGTTGGVYAEFDDMSQNNNGDVAFIATYTEDGGTTFKTGVWIRQAGGALVKVITHGDPVPAGAITCPSGYVSSGDPGDIDGPWMNDSQVVVFLIDGPCGNDSTAGDHLLVKQPSQPLAAFVTEGDPAPASIGGTIGGFKLGRPAFNNANVLGYRAVEITGSVAESVVTHAMGGSPIACVNLGAPAPGTTGTISSFVDNPPTINQSGRLFFVAGVTGDAIVSQGLFTCQNGSVVPVVFQGDPIPGTASVFSARIEEGSMSDDGRVAFLHENSPLGVFVSSAPVAITPVPALSRLAMGVLAGLLIGFAAWTLRRRSQAFRT